MSNIEQCIRSLLPGRLRLRHPMLFRIEEQTVSEIESVILSIEGVTRVTVNPRVGSLLIEWDESVADTQTVLGTLESYASMFLFSQSGEEDDLDLSETESEDARTEEASCPVCKMFEVSKECVTDFGQRAGRTLEKKVVGLFSGAARTVLPEMAEKQPARAARTLQNRTMLLLLGTSVGMLAVKNTAVHVVAGTAFMSILGVHLWQHRRVL